MRPVRFVHAADLHLEAPFAGVDASDPIVRASLAVSTFEAFERIVSLCLDERVDFLVIAGDVYDNARNFNAQLQFQRQATRLEDAGIPVYVVEGNHDPESQRPRDLALPSNVRYLSTREVERIEVVRDGEQLCALYGRGYAKAAESRNLAKEFRREAGDAIAIGLLHTNVGGREGYEDYAPASLDDLRAARMDYFALGHIHKPEILSSAPAIVYAGCPQGRSPKEDGARGCYLVEVSPGHADVAFHATQSVLWERLSLDASDMETADDVRDALRAACARVRRTAGGPAVVRFDLVGRSAAHGPLARGTNLEDLVRDLREEQLADASWIWIDRVRDRTSGTLDITTLREAQDFSGDLVRLSDELGADSASLDALVTGLLASIRSSLGDVDLEMSPAELLERARDLCLDRLEGEAR